MRSRFGLAAFVAAIIWAAVILASDMVIGNSPEYSRLLNILDGGAAATIILLGGLAAQEKRKL